jgi:hypothetical protein
MYFFNFVSYHEVVKFFPTMQSSLSDWISIATTTSPPTPNTDGESYCRASVTILRESFNDSLSTLADLVLDGDADTAQYQIERTIGRDGETDVFASERSLLHFAIVARSLRTVQLLLLHDAHHHRLINECDVVTGQTPLHIALFARWEPAIRLLLAHGADDSIPDHFGASVRDWSALLFAPLPIARADRRIALLPRAATAIEMIAVDEFERRFHIEFLETTRADLSYVLELSFSGFALGERDVAFRAQYAAALLEEEAPCTTNNNDTDLVVAFVNDAVGWGLFAGRAYRADEFVCRYGGIARSDHAMTDRSYAVASSVDGCAIDASRCRSLGGFINHCDTPNVTFQCVFERGVEQVLVIANRNIARGDQLLHNYTARYFGGGDDDAASPAPPLDLAGSRIDLPD